MLISWLAIESTESSTSNGGLKVSVIVPFRNETKNLPYLVESLKKQDYPNFEVILVNDHSDDNFNLVDLPSNFILLDLPKDKTGKKSAINHGINHSKGEIILTTDADCIVESKWISTMTSQFQNEKIKLVLGGVRFNKSKSFFERLQQIEFAPVIGIGAALSQLGKPIMCNGANLAYRKSVFTEVNGYYDNLNIPTGDDEFLLFKVINKYPNGIIYCKSKNALVTTAASTTLQTFISQRRRWASKWKANKGLLKPALALLVFLSSLAMVAGFYLALSNTDPFLFSFLLVKILIDGIFIFSVLKSMERSFNPIVFLLTQLVYPFYVLIVGIAANFGTYKWKGRTF